MRELREAAGLSRSQLEGVAGLRRRAVEDLETGSGEPRVGLLLKVAAALGSTVGELVGSEQPLPLDGVIDGLIARHGLARVAIAVHTRVMQALASRK